MPDESRLVGVKLAVLPDVVYGFRTNIASTSSTALGHVALLNAGNYVRGAILGVNTPKPPKAKKFFGTATKRYESSFIDKDKIDAARADGWIITPAKPQRLRSTAYSKLVYVDFKMADPADANGQSVTIKYAWRMPLAQYTYIGADRAALGISDVTGNDIVVMGANNGFKPLRASNTATVAGKLKTTTTFIDSSKAGSLPAGWA